MVWCKPFFYDYCFASCYGKACRGLASVSDQPGLKPSCLNWLLIFTVRGRRGRSCVARLRKQSSTIFGPKGMQIWARFAGYDFIWRLQPVKVGLTLMEAVGSVCSLLALIPPDSLSMMVKWLSAAGCSNLMGRGPDYCCFLWRKGSSLFSCRRVREL